jgi:hypothetical protein
VPESGDDGDDGTSDKKKERGGNPFRAPELVRSRPEKEAATGAVEEAVGAAPPRGEAAEREKAMAPGRGQRKDDAATAAAAAALLLIIPTKGGDESDENGRALSLSLSLSLFL